MDAVYGDGADIGCADCDSASTLSSTRKGGQRRCVADSFTAAALPVVAHRAEHALYRIQLLCAPSKEYIRRPTCPIYDPCAQTARHFSATYAAAARDTAAPSGKPSYTNGLI